MNFRNIGILILAFGSLLNTIVVVANNGFMPVDINAVKLALCLKSDKEAEVKLLKICAKTRRHTILDKSTRFKILADTHLGTYSIGDFLIFIGLAIIMIHLSYLCLIYMIIFLN